MKIEKIGIKMESSEEWLHFYIVLQNINNLFNWISDEKSPKEKDLILTLVNSESSSVFKSLLLVDESYYSETQKPELFRKEIKELLRNISVSYPQVDISQLFLNEEVEEYIKSPTKESGVFAFLKIGIGIPARV